MPEKRSAVFMQSWMHIELTCVTAHNFGRSIHSNQGPIESSLSWLAVESICEIQVKNSLSKILQLVHRLNQMASLIECKGKKE